jgi:hypothetical protein
MKEQLVEMTGLSPRVIRVWFQNKRCKDKKKTIALKQQMQEKVISYDSTDIGYTYKEQKLHTETLDGQLHCLNVKY